MKFKVVKTKGKMFLVTFDDRGVVDTIHELKTKTNIQANRVDTSLVLNPMSLTQIAHGNITNNLVDVE